MPPPLAAESLHLPQEARNRVAGSGQPGAGGVSGQQLVPGSSGHMVGPNGVAGGSGGGNFSNPRDLTLAQRQQQQQLETQRGLMTSQQAAQVRGRAYEAFDKYIPSFRACGSSVFVSILGMP